MGIYIKQLLAGRDFARANQFAAQMGNYVYLIGDDEQRVCMIVDPAWDVPDLLDIVEAEGMTLTGALVTHYHPDHVGGEIFGYGIEGVGKLLELRPVRIYVNALESAGMKAVTGISANDMVRVQGGDQVLIGAVPVKLLHTPGHTPGSQCFLTEQTLVSGDTLFIGGCGRVDLPGGDSEQLYFSLTQVLGKLPSDTLLYPGHNYASKSSSTIGEELQTNRFMQMRGLESWKSLMSGLEMEE
jgi:hydroxyacylglutathione hydrolase